MRCSYDHVRCRGKPARVRLLITSSSFLIVSSVITFESIIPPESSLMAALREINARASLLSTFRSSYPTRQHHFPPTELSVEPTTLTFPLTGRPDKSPDRPIAPGKLARINPFASFFGSSPVPSASSALPDVPTSAQSLSPPRPISPSSPHSSHISLEADTTSVSSDVPSDTFSITAYAVPKVLRNTEISKSLSKSLRTYVKEEFASSRFPEKLVERVIRLLTVVLSQEKPAGDGVELDFADPMGTSEKLQSFVEGVYDELLPHYRADSTHIFSNQIRKRASDESVKVDDREKKERKERQRREREDLAEREASEGTEKVEGLICRLLYNRFVTLLVETQLTSRLFSPLESDDARHDEALASRIAALNLLDLSLDHLGLITRPDDEEHPGRVSAGLSAITDRVGDGERLPRGLAE